MKDSRQKYLDISIAFNNRATEIDLFCKQSQRVCEMLANHLAKEKPKTAKEFERVEYLKDFVLKTSKNNEATLSMLLYIKGFLIDILDDSKVLMEGAILRDKLKFQSDTIEILQETQNKMVNDFFREHKTNS